MKDQTKRKSKFLSYVLRHNPGEIGIKLDSSGWVKVNELLKALADHGRYWSLRELEFVVEKNNKKRFAFSEDNSKIRASQGHSVKVDLNYEEKEPPTSLFHGTAKRFLNSIFTEGLLKMGRHHVHLSEDKETARSVGQRHGNLIILRVDSKEMHNDGHKFYLSENNVWLTDNVPRGYLTIISGNTND